MLIVNEKMPISCKTCKFTYKAEPNIYRCSFTNYYIASKGNIGRHFMCPLKKYSDKFSKNKYIKLPKDKNGKIIRPGDAVKSGGYTWTVVGIDKDTLIVTTHQKDFYLSKHNISYPSNWFERL